jgi:hypothetical protein
LNRRGTQKKQLKILLSRQGVSLARQSRRGIAATMILGEDNLNPNLKNFSSMINFNNKRIAF